MLTVGIAAGGHVLGGGEAPHPLTLAVLVLLASIPAYLLTGRRLACRQLVALLGGGQLAIHEVLMAMASMQPGGYLHGMAPTAHHAAEPSAGPPMLLAHAVATLVTSLLLARGESLVWVLWRLLLPLLAVPRVLVPLPRQLLTASTSAAPVSVLLARSDRPRGPPRGVPDSARFPATCST
jgi:hypothetical protein